MNKSAIVESLRQQLKAQYERAIKALEGAHEAATGEDTKAESKYDTRGLEASYLAAGQAEFFVSEALLVARSDAHGSHSGAVRI